MSKIAFRRIVAWVMIVALNVAQIGETVALTLATTPLAAMTTSVVRPNLMYVLDDSGSMSWDYTPDYINDATVTDPLNAGVGPAGTSGDTGAVTLSNGAATCPGGCTISAITATGGNTYYEQPTVLIEGGGGTGASATANWNSSTKKITSVTINNGGSGYTSKPFVTFIGKLSAAAWGMCWGTTGTSNQGGTPKDTATPSPNCTATSQLPYATAAINYQYYDPAVRYEAPLRADGTRWPNANYLSASRDAFSGASATNLTNGIQHEVWCNSSTAAPTLADPTAGGKCKENLSSSPDPTTNATVSQQYTKTFYPDVTYTFRKTYNGPAFYFTMSPSEYCTDDSYSNCTRSTAPVVSGATVFNVPSYYRWCSYYNPQTHAFGGCQGRRDWTHYIPNYLGGWISTGAAGVQASAALTITGTPSAGQQLTAITVGGIDIVGSTTFTSAGSDASTIATDICTAVNANRDSTGYGCSASGAVATIQAAAVGTAANNLPVVASGPPDASAVNSSASFKVVSAASGSRIDSILITRSDATTQQLLGASVNQVNNSIADTSQAICNAMRIGPGAALYDFRSRDSADNTVAWNTCNASANGLVEIRRRDPVATDTGATVAITGPTGNVGTITVNATAGATRINDITVGGVSVVGAAVAKPWTYADGNQTTTIASDIAGKISNGGCTATSSSNTVTLSGTSCSGAVVVTSTAGSATGTFRVTSSGSTAPGDLTGIQVGTTDIVGHVTKTQITDGSAVSTNATTLKNQVAGGFTAAAPVSSGGGNYDVTVTAPAGNTYNGSSFSFLTGCIPVSGVDPCSAAAGAQPQWTFSITGASTDNAHITSMTCGGTTTVPDRNTGTTSANVSYVQNLAIGASTNGLNGKSSAGLAGYSYACTNASMASPQYRCTVTGPAGVAACSNLTITKDASITLSTTTPAASGGTAGTPKSWAFDFSNATKDSKSITDLRCGTTDTSPQTLNSTISTGSSTASYADNLKNGLDDSSASNWDQYADQWSGGSSSCTVNANGTVSCTYQKKNDNCINPYIGTSAGLSVSSQSPSTSSSLTAGNNLTFTISGIDTTSETVSEVSCAVDTRGGNTPSTSDSYSGSTRAERLASAIINEIDTTYWNLGASTCTASSTSVNCALKPETGYCPQSGAADGGLIVTVSSGMSVNTPSFNSGTGKWEFTISGADSSGETVTSLRCRPNALGATASTGASGNSDSRVVQRLKNLRTALDGQDNGDFTWSCPTAPTNASPTLACTATLNSTAGATASACTSTQLRMWGSDQTGVYIGSSTTQVDDSKNNYNVTYTSGSGGSSPTWVFDIQNATTANATISAITCGSSILPASAPSTGTDSSAEATRVNNLTGASAPSTAGNIGPTNGYTLSCNPFVSGAAACTLNGPTGAAACNNDSASGFVINKDSSISIGAITRTQAGSAGGVTAQDFAPRLSTVSAFSGGYASQSTTTTSMAVLTTIPVSPVSPTFSVGAPSATLTIATNTSGTSGFSLNMAGGADPDTSTNHWDGVGVFQRVDIVSSNNSYARSSGRTDCTSTTCTYAEEIQNYANWYSYYRTRMQLMKSATSIAFNQLDGNYRVGFDRICNNGATSVIRPVAQFLDTGGETANQKTNWYSSLTGTTANCATPLRASTAKIGKYFAGKLSGSTDPIEYSCQQNFLILVTDGYWNESEPLTASVTGSDVANQDNVLGTGSGQAPRPYYDGAQASTTCPGTGTRSSASSCRTLSDIAWYYYSTDLRSTTFSNKCNAGLGNTCADGSANDVSINNVLTTADDKNQAQHMNFYAMGLGIDGTLDYRSDYLTAGVGDFAQLRAGTKNWPAVANLDPTAVDDLWHATANGRGKYFSARNVPNVIAGLREALNKIGARVGSAAAAATSNLEPVAGDNFAYVASYATVDWTGDLQSRSINISTGDVSPDTNCSTTGSGCQWSAQAKLDQMPWQGRRIYMKPTSGAYGDPLLAFTWANLSLAQQAYFSPSSLSQYAALSVSNPSDITAENLVNFLRGDRSLEQDGNISHSQIWRARAHVLGDIVNTQPIYSRSPNRQYTDTGYTAFKSSGTAASRRPVVFVSSQDGMVHAINADTAAVSIGGSPVQPGEELWAFVPQQAMSSMKVLADTNYTLNHRYFVDGPLTVADVDFGANNWHTILVGGQGAGGTSYFAIDITDPLNPAYLWEFTHTSLGYTFSNPTVTKLPNGEWAVLFSSGYNNSDNKGYLFAVNPQTGALKTGFPMATNTGSAGSPANLGKIGVWVNNPATDNTAQWVYVGGTDGNLWRFDLDPNAANHSGTAVFKLASLTDSGGTPQAITTKPELTTNDDGQKLVFVGTGKYLESTDLTNTQTQTFYAMKDTMGQPNNGGASQDTWNPATDTMLSTPTQKMFLDRKLIDTNELGAPLTVTVSGVTRSIRKVCRGASSVINSAGACASEDTTAMDWSTLGGWKVSLPDSGERLNVDPKLVSGTLVFATNVPGASSCTVGGSAWVNFLYYSTGLAVSGEEQVSTKITDSLVVGITVVRLSTGEYKAIATKSNYQQETITVPVDPTPPPSGGSSSFQNKRSTWREFEAY